MSVLKMVWKYLFFNNVSRVKNQRMSWTPDFHEKFEESVQKLGGAANATPRKILQYLQSNFKGFEDVDREKVSSHLQKYRDSLKKKAQPHMLGCKDKDGTSSEHIQSRYEMEEHAPMTLVDQVLKTAVANEPYILSQQQQAPAAKNTQGFQSVTLPFVTNVPTTGGSTSCGNQSNALMIQMDEAFSSEQMPFVTLPFETNLPTIGGSTGCGNQSNALMIQMDEAFSSEQMPFVRLPFETKLPTIGGSTNCGNQSNALMIQMDEAFSSEQMPFVTLPFETNLPTIGGSTSCGNQSNALMTQMDEAFSSEQMQNEFTGGQPFDYKSFLNDIDASTNDISGDPGFFSINAPVPSPFHIDHGEYGFSSDGMFENFTGDVIAPEHFNNL
ncbi:hypothetical protein ACB092_05G041700 [Castanea dentata]